MTRVNSIQYLRAIAALSVVIFHTLQSSTYRFPVGAAGVDIFFVISGFIMASLISSNESDPTIFIVRRLARILPLYWFCTLAAIIINNFKPGIFYEFDPSIQNLILSLLFIPHIGTTALGSPTLGQGWTLEYEMFFYFLCLLSLIFFNKNRLYMLTCIILTIVIFGILFNPSQKILSTYSSPLLCEFAFGIGLSMAWRARLLPNFQPTGWILACLGVAVFVGETIGIIPLFGVRALDWGIPAFMIVAGALMAENAGMMPISRLGLILGDSSYALYLTHGFVISPFLWKYSDKSVVERLIVCIALSVTLAIIIIFFVERPLYEFFRKALTPRKTLRNI